MNSEQQVKHGIFPFGEKNDKYARSFVGQSYLSMLAANPDIPVPWPMSASSRAVATTGMCIPMVTRS